jgi:hypothetical protein
MPERLTRRAALAGAVALALRPATAAARGADEGEALTALVRAELEAAYAYAEGGPAPASAATAAAHAGEHARALASHLEALGLPIPEPVRRREDLSPTPLMLVEARSGEERLLVATRYEQELAGGCSSRLGQLVEPNTIRTVVTILASHAQRQALLRRDAGKDPLSPER